MTKKNSVYCNDVCELDYTNLFNQKHKRVFRTFSEAGRFYNRDFRTMKKFEGVLFVLDKKINAPNTKWVLCKTCKSLSPKSKARKGYCKECTFNGLGRKNQGKVISEKYKGIGNPNYLNGESKAKEYQHNKWHKLKQQLKFDYCALTGIKDNINYHHIIPRWFCKLVNIDIFDSNNIIGLNSQYHKAVHHLQLDILLLPILYPLYKKDALQLRSQFVNLLQLHKVHQYPVDQLQSLNLFQLARYPGKKKLLDLLPEFRQLFLTHKQSK